MNAELNRRYVERYFWSLQDLAAAAGASKQRVSELIKARCAPGPIYVSRGDVWWSALDRRTADMPEGEAWFSPGSAWGLRRALLATREGARDADAAEMLKDSFVQEFLMALGVTKGAELAFPDCFVADGPDPSATAGKARSEWSDWLDGGYGVCLRVFTGRNCVAKEALGASIRRSLASARYDRQQLLMDAEALAGLMLPFAPWQRQSCTPGRTIDPLLTELNLGSARSYAGL